MVPGFRNLRNWNCNKGTTRCLHPLFGEQHGLMLCRLQKWSITFRAMVYNGLLHLYYILNVKHLGLFHDLSEVNLHDIPSLNLL